MVQERDKEKEREKKREFKKRVGEERAETRSDRRHSRQQLQRAVGENRAGLPSEACRGPGLGPGKNGGPGQHYPHKSPQQG